MADKRKSRRRIKRRQVMFLCANREYKGISSNFSETGLFIKTRYKFKHDSPVCMVLKLDDNHKTAVKGKVIRITTKSKFFDNYRISRHGIGIELTEITQEYKEFCENILKEKQCAN